jgi:hypothetical protein
MNGRFTLPQGTDVKTETVVNIYVPPFGTTGYSSDPKRVMLLIEQQLPTSGDPADPGTAFDTTYTNVLMTKAEARAIASALMGTAVEL